MTVQPYPGRSKATRRRKRRLQTKTLVFVAVAACLLLMIGRSTAQVVSRLSCVNKPLNISIAVSTDIFPAISQIADVFNREDRQAEGHCITVQVNPGSPAAAAAQIDGQHPDATGNPINAWIPDSSLWVDEVRGSVQGSETVDPAGFSVARSPLMIVMPAAAEARTPGFYKDGWKLLMPPSIGGPSVPSDLRVDLPDPTQTAAGLATLVEINRVIGPVADARLRFTKFAHATAVTSYFDDPTSLSSFVSLAQPPLDGDPVTVTTEQAVLAYDAANPHQPLAATYPSGKSDALGDPELDYPYVLLATSSPAQLAAANVFGEMLQSRYAASVIRYNGFRSANGTPGQPDRFPASYGLASQLLQVATPATPTETPTALQSWNKIALGSRDLTMIDVSSNMGKSLTPGSPTYEQELTQAASIGLSLFANSSNLGLWEFSTDLNGTLPYKQLVNIGPLPANIGVLSRRDELEHISANLTPSADPDVALYGTILAGYKYMLKTYQPNYFNGEILLGSGIENDPGDITADQLIKKLEKLSSPSRKVVIIMVIFGSPPNFSQLQHIAELTGGQAYEISTPSQVYNVFFQALARRLCDPSC
ncbi:MAG TPA: substrate-binding domain-containing protein [Streptosporangiaceae bacterium]|nr:substrate-binding domain-containing protein [Streptosporangiaceae bacterium]